MRAFTADDVWGTLSMVDAIHALERSLADGFPPAPQRLHLEERGQLLLVMPSMADGYAGTKLITIDARNPERGLPLVNGTYTLFAPPGLEPVATFDGRALTELRTAAVSGLATRHLARTDATRLVVIGTGAQARSHLVAMAAVLPITEVVLVGRRRARVDELAAFARDRLAARVTAGTAQDLSAADVVCACTSSSTPVVEGTLLSPGVHVNAIGAYLPTMAEVDAGGVAACKVVVETRDAARAEKGDLLQAQEAGAWSFEDVAADLPELVRGAAVRTSDDDRTLFASVGVAYEDLVIARAVFERASGAGS